jgi:hypothetical protein
MIIVVLFFIILSTTLLIGISNPISNQIKQTSDFLTSKSSYNVADAQTENAMYRFNKGQTDAPTDITVLGSTATAVLTTVGQEKDLVVEGINSIFDRYIKSAFVTGSGVSFNYGLQSGIGGLVMSGSAYITGNVYSNGDITGNGGSGWYTTYITGSAVAATISNPAVSIDVSSPTAATSSYAIGQSNTNQDIAESFVAATTTPISEVHFLMKKTGSPANATIKIVNNNGSNPGSTVLTSGTLNSSTVSTAFAYVPTAMSSAVNLVAGATYWVVIDNPGNDNSNYYSLFSYNGASSTVLTKQGKYVSSMSNLSPSTLDFGMRLFVGGDKGSISNMGVGTSGTGDAWANTVTNTTVSGNLYCSSGSGNNKSCDSSRADPVMVDMPISDANINDWKSQAATGGATSSVNVGGADTKTIGPIQINGNLTVGGSGTLYIKGPVYVTGYVDVEGSGKIYVDPSLGSASGIIIADNYVTLGGSGGVYGSGTTGSYIILASTKSCTTISNCSSNPSITVSGAAGSVILNAPDGGVAFTGSTGVKAVVAKQMNMSGTAHIVYDSGIANMSFTSGPSGSWTTKSWKEALGW